MVSTELYFSDNFILNVDALGFRISPFITNRKARFIRKECDKIRIIEIDVIESGEEEILAALSKLGEPDGRDSQS